MQPLGEEMAEGPQEEPPLEQDSLSPRGSLYASGRLFCATTVDYASSAVRYDHGLLPNIVRERGLPASSESTDSRRGWAYTSRSRQQAMGCTASSATQRPSIHPSIHCRYLGAWYESRTGVYYPPPPNMETIRRGSWFGAAGWPLVVSVFPRDWRIIEFYAVSSRAQTRARVFCARLVERARSQSTLFLSRLHHACNVRVAQLSALVCPHSEANLDAVKLRRPPELRRQLLSECRAPGSLTRRRNTVTSDRELFFRNAAYTLEGCIRHFLSLLSLVAPGSPLVVIVCETGCAVNGSHLS